MGRYRGQRCFWVLCATSPWEGDTITDVSVRVGSRTDTFFASSVEPRGINGCIVGAHWREHRQMCKVFHAPVRKKHVSSCPRAHQRNGECSWIRKGHTVKSEECLNKYQCGRMILRTTSLTLSPSPPLSAHLASQKPLPETRYNPRGRRGWNPQVHWDGFWQCKESETWNQN